MLSLFLLKTLKKILTLLQSEISPNQIAGGFALGSIMGFTPFFALHNLAVFLLILLLKVNIGAALLAAALFKIAGAFTDPLAHRIGYQLLVNAPSLTDVWTSLYNMPVIPFTRFYNTVVLGSLVIAVALFIPVFLGARWFVAMYRARWKDRVAKWKIMKLLKLTSVYNVYDSYK